MLLIPSISVKLRLLVTIVTSVLFYHLQATSIVINEYFKVLSRAILAEITIILGAG